MSLSDDLPIHLTQVSLEASIIHRDSQYKDKLATEIAMLTRAYALFYSKNKSHKWVRWIVYHLVLWSVGRLFYRFKGGSNA